MFSPEPGTASGRGCCLPPPGARVHRALKGTSRPFMNSMLNVIRLPNDEDLLRTTWLRMTLGQMYALCICDQIFESNSHSQRCAYVWTSAGPGGWRTGRVLAGRSIHPSGLHRNASFPKGNEEMLSVELKLRYRWLRLVLKEPSGKSLRYIV